MQEGGTFLWLKFLKNKQKNGNKKVKAFFLFSGVKASFKTPLVLRFK